VKLQDKREAFMHAVARSYSGQGAKELIDVLEKNKSDIEKLIKSIRGFVSYSLVRTADGGFSVSVFQDKAGVEESVRVAREWVAKNAGTTGAAAPTIAEGTVILQLK
jgi:hypothetical protein